MAITLTPYHYTHGEEYRLRRLANSDWRLFMFILDTTGTNYTTGGWACDLRSYIKNTLYLVIADNPSGYVAQYDYTNRLLLVYSAVTVELTQAQHDLSFKLIAIGR